MKRIGDAIQTRTQAKDPQSYHVIPYRGGTWGHNGKTSPANKTRAKQIKVKNAPLVYRGGGGGMNERMPVPAHQRQTAATA